MKRSKAIDIITSYIDGVVYDPDSEYINNHELCAKDILKALENRGMLPPTTTIKIGDTEYKDNCWEEE